MRVPKILKSKRILLRRQIPEDEIPFVNFMTDPESTQFLSLSEEQKTIEGAKSLLEYTINSYNSENPLFILSCEDKQSKEFIGVCGLNPLIDNEEIEIFYTVIQSQRGKGYASEMAQALIEYLKDSDYKRLIAFIMQHNIFAQHVAHNSGFKNSGLVVNDNFAEKVYRYIYKL